MILFGIGPHLLRCILKVLEPLYPSLHHISRNNGDLSCQDISVVDNSFQAQRSHHLSSSSSSHDAPAILEQENSAARTGHRDEGGKDQPECTQSSDSCLEVKEVNDGDEDRGEKKCDIYEKGDGNRADSCGEEGSELETERLRQFQVLFDVLQGFLHDFVNHMQVVSV